MGALAPVTWFRVSGLGFRGLVRGLGCRGFRGLGFKGLGFGVSGFGFRAWDLGYQVFNLHPTVCRTNGLIDHFLVALGLPSYLYTFGVQAGLRASFGIGFMMGFTLGWAPTR